MASTNPIDEATNLQLKYDKLKRNSSKTKGFLSELAAKEKIPKSSLSRKLKLLQLDDDTQFLIKKGLLEPSFAELIFKLPSHQQQSFAEKIVREKMSHRRAKQLVDGMLNNQRVDPVKPIELSTDLERLMESWEEEYGIQIKVHNSEVDSSVELKSWDSSFIKDVLMVPVLWESDCRFVVDTPQEKSGRNPFSINIYEAENQDIFRLIEATLSGYQRIISYRKKKITSSSLRAR